ncbi:hypothetical protein Forpi1262_v004082 [Fusarium oxysporum f. sp. raphani]|uniref:Uncharacterized protein n=1 Tax=Fusarium oxysporum f. sp. raphani TaxID=96318 RepID=A0A8J5UB89_FUSOX|nr:hypothetical protein Forpi1262_v004082 [Fusarium oxysporum f. sp. raphani]
MYRSRYPPLTARPRLLAQATPGQVVERPSTPPFNLTPPLHPLRVSSPSIELPSVQDQCVSFQTLAASICSSILTSLIDLSNLHPLLFPLLFARLSVIISSLPPILNFNFIVAAHLSSCAVSELKKRNKPTLANSF